jgi:hypothetical protein
MRGSHGELRLASGRFRYYTDLDIPEFTPSGVTATDLWTRTVPCATSADVTLTGKQMSTEQCSILRVSQERHHARKDSPVRFTQ